MPSETASELDYAYRFHAFVTELERDVPEIRQLRGDSYDTTVGLAFEHYEKQRKGGIQEKYGLNMDGPGF
jgi:hypothetical protein